MCASKPFNITRYPTTTNRSLQAWNAADEFILQHMTENQLVGKMAIYEDRFGYLACHLSYKNQISVIEYRSQQKAIHRNLQANTLTLMEEASVLDQFVEPVDVALIKVPKSMGLFRMYLRSASLNLKDEGTVICGFMTRNFTPTMLEIAADYFDSVEQTKARKKSRLMILKGKKKSIPPLGMECFTTDLHSLQNVELRQYPGVFSSGKIDIGTLFLLDHLPMVESDQTILDLASGNGVLAKALRLQNPLADIHLVDDSRLAIESSKLNMTSEHTHFHHNDSLEEFGESFFDLVISNPPFHFGHENNIEVSLNLFHQVYRALRKGGRFRLVANRHLNYGHHLRKEFFSVQKVANNEKFEILEAIK